MNDEDIKEMLSAEVRCYYRVIWVLIFMLVGALLAFTYVALAMRA